MTDTTTDTEYIELVLDHEDLVCLREALSRFKDATLGAAYEAEKVHANFENPIWMRDAAAEEHKRLYAKRTWATQLENTLSMAIKVIVHRADPF